MRSEVSMAVKLWIVIQLMKLCSPVCGYQCFEEMYCLSLQVDTYYLQDFTVS
jgi:hypothetical protein